MTLDKWQVKTNDSYYVLPRRKEQPFWTYQESCDEAIETSEGTFNISYKHAYAKGIGEGDMGHSLLFHY